MGMQNGINGALGTALVATRLANDSLGKQASAKINEENEQASLARVSNRFAIAESVNADKELEENEQALKKAQGGVANARLNLALGSQDRRTKEYKANIKNLNNAYSRVSAANDAVKQSEARVIATTQAAANAELKVQSKEAYVDRLNKLKEQGTNKAFRDVLKEKEK